VGGVGVSEGVVGAGEVSEGIGVSEGFSVTVGNEVVASGTGLFTGDDVSVGKDVPVGERGGATDGVRVKAVTVGVLVGVGV